jgi:putative transposase
MEKRPSSTILPLLIKKMEGGGALAKVQSIDLRRALKDLFPDRLIEELARESGFIVRERKVKAVPFFWSLVLGFGKATTRSISNLRRSYESASGETLVPSAFYDRFDDNLVSMLRSATGHALDSFQLAGAEAKEVAKAFKDVIVSDASVIKLFDDLKTVFPGCRTNSAPAAAKIHAFLSVKGAGKSTVANTSERVHDKKKLQIGKWVRDKLLLFDLGYYRYQLFSCIDRNGGFFISRLKENANPTLTALIRKVRGNSIDVEGRRLQDILANLRREVLDVEAEVLFPRRTYGGHRSRGRERYRVVAIRDEKTEKYHAYITNIPPDVFTAEAIASGYRARWLIEMVFKELKSGYRIHQIPSGRRPVAEAFLYAGILTLLASRKLFRLLAAEEQGHRFRVGRWWSIFAANAFTLLYVLLHPRQGACLLDNFMKTLRHELTDPHLKREPLLVEAFG